MTTRLFHQAEWMQRGACVGVHVAHFFPERGEPTREAKAVCAGCEVRDDCLAYAMDNRIEHGIWGGTSERERKRLRRQRRQAGAA